MPFRRWFNSEARIFWSLAGVALVVRAVGAITNTLISRDGAVFTDRARWMLEGHPERALEVFPQMPTFYSTLIAFLGAFTGDLSVAGCLISIVAGTATLAPLYLLTRDLWNAKTAAVTGLIFAVLPAIASLGSEVMSESLFILFFVGSAAMTWSTAKNPSWSLAAVNGCCAALALQTRAEGIYLVAAMLGWTLLSVVRNHNAPDRFVSRAALAAGVFVLVYLLTAAPYLLWIRAKLGHWGVSVNPYALAVMGQHAVFEDRFAWDQPWVAPVSAVPPSFMAKFGGASFAFLDSLTRLLFAVLLPFLILGWVRWRKEGAQPLGALFLSLLALGYWAPTFLPFLVGGVYAPRYLVPGVVFALPFIAAGLQWTSGRIPERVRWQVSTAFMILLFGYMGVKDVRPHRRDTSGIREAGAVLRERFGPGKSHVAVMDTRIMHYADGHAILSPPTLERIERAIQIEKPVSIVLASAAAGKSVFGQGEPDLERKLEARYPLVRKIVSGTDWIAIYSVP